MSAFVGNAAGLVVLMGILFAWWEPVSSHLLHAASLALAAVALAVICVRARSFDVHWWVLLPLGAALLGLGQATLGWSVYPYETWNSVGAWLARAAVFWAAFVGFGTAARREALARGIV
ncbi:MAG TPA: hypothetical protein VEQ63_00050, partial [Bryobacteraceae bacterium]|nr:hypothetical protein [Bryobacteraceae bacterium]